MRTLSFTTLAVTLSVSALCAGPVASPPVVHHATGTGGAVASGHPLATQAGLNVLRHGGNAIDAAVAVGLTLGVVDGHNSGIGGGCFFLVRRPDGSLLALDGREMAPAAARRDMYLRADGSADTSASQTGPRAPGIPGSLAVYDHVLAKHGSSSIASHLTAAAEIAERGYRIHAAQAARLEEVEAPLNEFAGPESPFFRPDQTVLQAGDVLVQKDLARTYRTIAKQGVSWFYGGGFARRTEKWMRDHGGVITARDFADYRVKERVPLRTTCRGHEIIGFPPRWTTSRSSPACRTPSGWWDPRRTPSPPGTPSPSLARRGKMPNWKPRWPATSPGWGFLSAPTVRFIPAQGIALGKRENIVPSPEGASPNAAPSLI